jgi:uncharacterized protein YcbK (DUF882 family)
MDKRIGSSQLDFGFRALQERRTCSLGRANTGNPLDQSPCLSDVTTIIHGQANLMRGTHECARTLVVAFVPSMSIMEPASRSNSGGAMNRRYFLGLALSAVAAPALAAKKKQEQPRVLSFYNLHTDERLTLAYRIGDRYQRSALHKLNHFLRDYRTDDVTVMDPRLFDLLFDINNRIGTSEGTFEVVCGYRCPATNAWLRKVSWGVAKHSLHLTGQAVDIRHNDVSTRNIRDTALALRQGGVGYYPRSDFVHVDTGAVRHWGA